MSVEEITALLKRLEKLDDNGHMVVFNAIEQGIADLIEVIQKKADAPLPARVEAPDYGATFAVAIAQALAGLRIESTTPVTVQVEPTPVQINVSPTLKLEQTKEKREKLKFALNVTQRDDLGRMKTATLTEQ